MFEHNNENAKQVLKGLSNPDSQYRYDNMPCDCSSDKVDEMVRKSERCEPIAHQCIHINELTKRIEELEKKQETIDSIDKRLINVECALYNHIIGNAESAEPAEWKPAIGKSCLYSGEGCVNAEGMVVQIDDSSLPEVPYLVYLYEHNIAYWASRDELKPMPATFNEK